MTWPGQPPAGEPVDPNAAWPGYAQPGYPQPGYPPPGYAPPPPGYPVAGYPQVGYPSAYPYPYGYPRFDPANVRPGLATSSAVLGFITSGLLILAGLLLFLGGAIAGDLEDASGSGTHIGAELALDGVVNLIAAGLLIAGGVALIGRRPNGRILLSVGGGIVLAASIYWLTRFDDLSSDSWVFDAGLFLVLAALSVVFAWVSPVTAWLNRRPT